MLLQLPKERVDKFFTYDEDELAKLPPGRKGLRLYSVVGLKKDKVGGKEFHRCKKEFFFIIDGSMSMECEDLYGNKRTCHLSPKQGLFIPPFILHTYTMESDGSFIVVANTLFDREDKRTYDTYSLDTFRELQAQAHNL
jgi:oxalate decarboxylase/phosphoglucose isomerase-like protein (cupin superfamily)